MPFSTYRDWSYVVTAEYEGEALARYSISFFRYAGEWYDQIRYDSHEKKKGRDVVAPHFHLKLGSAFKSGANKAVEEIKEVIDNHLSQLQEVMSR